MSAVLRVAACALVFAAACGGASDVEHPADRPHRANADVDWRDQVIYQIMVDRFANGDPNNDFNVEPSVPGKFHGGDWQGIIDHLDYLKSLGVTALWISPVVKNVEEDGAGPGGHRRHGRHDSCPSQARGINTLSSADRPGVLRIATRGRFATGTRPG